MLLILDIPDNQLSSHMKRGFLNSKKAKVVADKVLCDKTGTGSQVPQPPSGDCAAAVSGTRYSHLL